MDAKTKKVVGIVLTIAMMLSIVLPTGAYLSSGELNDSDYFLVEFT